MLGGPFLHDGDLVGIRLAVGKAAALHDRSIGGDLDGKPAIELAEGYSQLSDQMDTSPVTQRGLYVTTQWCMRAPSRKSSSAVLICRKRQTAISSSHPVS